MPTPIGHAIGGLAAAFFADSVRRRPVLSPRLVLASAALAMAPDLDLLTGSHRTYTHSIGAVALVFAVSWLVLRGRTAGAARAAAVATAAYASHLALDWAGKDSSRPPGFTILWPFSRLYSISGLDLFGEVSRRYWRPEEFIIGNMRAVAWELVVLLPIALIAWLIWSRRTVA